MEAASTTMQQEIQKAIGWNESEYAQFIYDCGLAYLIYYIGDESEEILSQIRKSRIFWNWWKIHWEKRNEGFMVKLNDHSEVEDWLEVYLETHDPKTLASEIYPSGVVLGESYEAMMRKLRKEVMHA
jgi:hypothetical protein